MSEQDNKPKLPQGVLVSGIVQGIREDIYNDRTTYYLGLGCVSKNDYGQEKTDLEEIRLSGDNLQQLVDKAKVSIGKHCIVPVEKRALKSNAGNAYMRTNIVRDGQLMIVG